MAGKTGLREDLIERVDESFERLERGMKSDGMIVIRPREIPRANVEWSEPPAILKTLLGGDGWEAESGAMPGWADLEALDHVPRALHVFDEMGIIRYTNAAFDDMFGYRRGALRGRHLAMLNFYSIEENARIMAGIIVKAHSRGHWKGDLSYRRKDNLRLVIPTYIQPFEVSGHRYWIAVQEEPHPVLPCPGRTHAHHATMTARH